VSKIEPRVTAALDHVILTALEPDRRRRYQSAVELQRDWLEARSTSAEATRQKRAGIWDLAGWWRRGREKGSAMQ
jgi:hypothetical protein